ncbi:MAG: M81 family metallopeptidase [Anaerolineae bacterium]
MRIGIVRIAQETNTFCPVLTDLETLQVHGVRFGQEVLEDTSGWSNIPGFLDVVGGEDLVGILSVHASPAGPLTSEAMETVLAWFADALERALPLDGLLFSMHGAFVGVADPDVEGLVLQKAREIVGNEVVIGAAMDLHANITRRKVKNANVIRGYHTHPHVDGRETARRVAEIALLALQGEAQPVMAAVKIPMITPAETQLTEQVPMRDLMDLTRQQEAISGVLSSSIFAVQPWMDIPEMGWCSVAVTDGDLELAERLARELAEMAWSQRDEYVRPCPTYVEALDQAFATSARPVVISDFADLMTGGGTGDSTWYLRELLRRNPSEPCYITVVDPESVREMARAGEGARLTLALGGKQDSLHSSPVEVTGQVLRVLPPARERELPESVGWVAVLKADNVYIVVLERLGPGSSPVLYSGAGLDPREAKVLIAKSVVDFREGYKGVAECFLLGEAPGLAPSNLRSLEWTRLPRPIFPLDDEIAWCSARAETWHSALQTNRGA